MRKERMRGQAMTAATICITVARAIRIRNLSKVVLMGTQKGRHLWRGVPAGWQIWWWESWGGSSMLDGGVRLWLWPGDMSFWFFMLLVSCSHLPF